MDQNKIELGMKVRTVAVLGATTGMLIGEEYLAARRPDCEGQLLNYVAGHGGDVWWVRHEHHDAAYVFTEFEPVPAKRTDVKGIEWKISDKSIERLGVDVTIIRTDGTRETKNVRLDGNATTSGLWGLSESIAALNKILGYEEKFWERPDHNDYERRRRKNR